MEAVVPSILPLKLKALGVPNLVMGLILTTIPAALNMTICPYVSFKSDRYRSKWGRRIPFIVLTMPFLCLSLVLIGFTDSISVFLQKYVDIAPVTLTIALIGLFMAVFQFFNMYVGSVFWYLFNDVVPAQFLARFVGTFRIVAAGGSAVYNYFVFKYAESHMREIFLGAAALYLIGFSIMCVMVKEGEYPPVEGEADKDNKGWGGLRTFFAESFSHKFYWLFFLFTSFLTVVGAVGTFNIFFQRDMGLTLDDIGKYNAIIGVVSLVAIYFTAIFVDRWHPLRVFMALCVFAVPGYLMSWVWGFVTLPAVYFFWLFMGSGLVSAFQSALSGACGLPLMMRLMPKSRYGQFCSAQALVRSFCFMVSGAAAGAYIDVVKWFCGGSDFAYRFMFVWMTFFGVITAWLGIWVYILWRRMGGDEHFQAPAPWSPSQKEELDYVPFVGPQKYWLSLALHLFHAVMILSVAGIPVLLWWMRRAGADMAFKWTLILILPLSILTWFCWWRLEYKIRQRMEIYFSPSGGESGITVPHHGVLVVVSVKFLLALSLWMAKVVVAVNYKMELGAVVFGAANVITNFLLIASVAVLCRVEDKVAKILVERSGRPVSADPFIAVEP
jgi:MFS family permease